MGCALWFASGTDSSWLVSSTLDRALRLAWVVALGAIVYFAMLWLLGFRLRNFSQKGVL
jgi:putative peptidoglycan lipid II flippase